MYPELWRDDVYEVVADQDAKAESDAYERGRWEAIKEAASYLQEVFGALGYASSILAHEAKLKKEREARRG
jgi:hypothetical protein